MASFHNGVSIALNVGGSSNEKLGFSSSATVDTAMIKEIKDNQQSDDASYEEIIVSDEEEYLEYYEEILDDGSDFTEVTCDSGGLDSDHGYLPQECVGNKPTTVQLDSVNVQKSATTIDNSMSSFSCHSDDESANKVRRRDQVKRPVIKTAREKALEEEKARFVKEENEISETHKFKLARKNSFCRKDDELNRLLREEEEQHMKEEDEREKQRLEEEAKIAQNPVTIQELKEEGEKIRLEKMDQEALRAAEDKAAVERARKEKERAAREAKKLEMEEEVRQLEAELAEKKRLAAEAEANRAEEQARLQAKVQARRQAKKEQEISSLSTQKEDQTQSQTPITPTNTMQAAEANVKYYSVDELRTMSVPGLDYKNREIYLCPADYQQIFGMTREEFDEQPKWKKTTLKRKAKLF